MIRKKEIYKKKVRYLLAEREGFEPSKGVSPYTLSKRAHSTTLPPLLLVKYAILAEQLTTNLIQS